MPSPGSFQSRGGGNILKIKYLTRMLYLLSAILLLATSCSSGASSPKEALDTYFTSAMKQDYAITYSCYYGAYKAKVSKEDYIKHRQEASVLKSYEILSLKQDGDTASAEVRLLFAPSEKLKRSEPAAVTVKEEMVKEGRAWKIKVW